MTCNKPFGSDTESSFCESINSCEFVPPPQAPVFYPTEEEFKDPLEYINKIRPIAENTGICKIIPPGNWKPPFSLDVDNFKFSARIQRLNLLDAKTRVKANFTELLFKFWELQGIRLAVPVIDKKPLDFYDLYRFAHHSGYPNKAKNDWINIAQNMGFAPTEDNTEALKHHFDKILRPFDVFYKGNDSKIKCEEVTLKIESCKDDVAIGGEDIKNAPPEQQDDEDDDVQEVVIEPSVYRELKRLQFRGAGPKIKGSNVSKRQRRKMNFYACERGKTYTCHNCARSDNERSLLACISCNNKYHLACVTPPLQGFPKRNWHCSKCVAMEICSYPDDFGFAQAEREYTLFEFGQFAENFKTNYFKLPAHLVPLDTVEKEYWRIASNTEEEVIVEYGADLHAVDNGSGFPTSNCTNLQPADLEYVCCGWNLNNFPILKNSVLRYINSDVSGMKIPWMYVGMCFATFCWHNEDHWSYSINYLHWGEPKTWYGIPGKDAELFEQTMRLESPELFQSQPDLLHQLVTIMNPNILMKANIPIYKLNQHEGEFVITFPRSYHMGFNQGFNFAEAVNFAPADWIKLGRDCIQTYAELKRFCVFSHDELLCAIASATELNPVTASATYSDLLQVFAKEETFRKGLLDSGLTIIQHEKFELLPDDKRHCEVCKTTCYLSGVACSSCEDRLVCLQHYADLCKCPISKRVLKYRYTSDELKTLLANVKSVVDKYDEWLRKVEDALNLHQNGIPSLSYLKSLFSEAKENDYPNGNLYNALSKAIITLEPFAVVILKLVNYENSLNGILNFDELLQLKNEVSQLQYVISEFHFIDTLFEKCVELEKHALCLLQKPLSATNMTELQTCIQNANQICVELPSLCDLRARYLQTSWLSEVAAILDSRRSNASQINDLLQRAKLLPPDEVIDNKVAKLIRVVRRSQTKKWVQNSVRCFPTSVQNLEVLVLEAPCPSIVASKNLQEWRKNLELLQNSQCVPCINDVRKLLKQGLELAANLSERSALEKRVNPGIEWLDQLSNMFLYENSTMNIVNALCPQIPFALTSIQRFCQDIIMEDNRRLLTIAESNNFEELSYEYRSAQLKELDGVRALRSANSSKTFANNQDKFCVCQQGPSGVMMRCELCRDWFHALCVDLPKYPNVTLPIALVMNPKDCRFLCSGCRRTKRPSLNSIIDFSKILTNFSVKIPEGELLRCLLDRCLAWQQQVSLFLQSAEMVPALDLVTSTCNKLDSDKPAKVLQVNYEDDDNFEMPTSRSDFKFLDVSDSINAQLENLLMEADTLEVELEEARLLWKLLLATGYYETVSVLKRF